jgi:hypothetical protein
MSMRLRTLDFAVAEAAVPPLAWLVLLGGALLFVLAVQGYTDADEEHGRLVRQADKLQRRARLTAPVARIADASAQEKSALATRRYTSPFPWDSVLRGLELGIDRSVALASMDTDITQRRTRIVAEARNIDDALAFATRLRKNPIVRQVLLLSHEAKKDPAGPVVGFSLQVDWSGE